MIVAVEIDKWEPFPGSKAPVSSRLPSKLRAVSVCSADDGKVEAELREKLYLQYGAIPAEIRFKRSMQR